MKRIHPLAGGIVAALAMTSVLVYTECLPTTTGAISINGIVAGTALAGGGGPPGGCVADAGWGGVAAKPFAPVGALPDTFEANALFVGRAAGANLDRLYLAIHGEGDDLFNVNDIVTMYVDANNNGSFDAPDFALRIEIGPQTPPSNNEACNAAVPETRITYYTFSGGSWNPQALPSPTAVIASTSFDYNNNMPDPESELWELEIEIRPSELGITIPIATGLRYGAKLYVDESVGTRVLAFPAGLTTNDDPNATNPNDGNVTPANLATLTIGSCGFDVQIESITQADAFGTAGKFTRFPNPVPSPLPATNTFNARVKFINPANLADVSAVAPNTGNVNFRVLPWNAGFLGDISMGVIPTTFNRLGDVRNVQISWPQNEAQYAPARALLASADHVCLKISLTGFPTNVDEPGDVRQQNLFFTTFSTVKDSFLIQSRRQEGPSGTNTYYLKPRFRNLPAHLIASPILKQGPAQGTKPVDLWSFRFTNADKIGLRDLQNGFHAITLKPGQQERVEIEVTGGTMPVQAQEFKLSPRAGGRAAKPASGEPPLAIDVKPGMTVTIVAAGLVGLYGNNIKRYPPNGPDGRVDRELRRRKFLLPEKGAYAGHENVGALVGSFDNFRTAFVIGGTSSFIVPEKRTKLYLAVNDQVGQYKDNTGEGFRLSVVMTPPTFLPTRLASPGIPANGLPVLADLGANLPVLNIDFLLFEEKPKQKKAALKPAGYVAFAAFNTHREQPGPR